MPKTRRVYPLVGYSPEIIAVAFAKTSRSPESFDEIAKEMSAEKSSQFHEKWVVGYGHSSVAEHAVLNIALENVSRYAVEAIEANRLASYTEKSSRYQVFTKDDFYMPKTIENSSKKDFYLENMTKLFENYQVMQDALEKVYREQGVVARKEGESERFFETRLRAYALDRARFIMPLSSLANLGWTINARALEHALTKMFSHPLQEVQEIAEEVKNVSQEVLPTLIKYAERNDYLVKTEQEFSKMFESDKLKVEAEDLYINMVNSEDQAEEKLLTAIMYRFSDKTYQELFNQVKQMSGQERITMIKEALKDKGRYDTPLREFEYITFTFDCLIDYGAYFDLKRHRICSQTTQLPTISHGYSEPELPDNLKLKYQESIAIAEQAYETLYQEFPQEARYFVLNAHRRRFLWQMNFREIMHVVKLRSKPNGHFTYRKFAQDLFLEFQKNYPVLAELIEVSLD